MTSTPRPPNRRPTRPVVGSRHPTGRPRKIAGRAPESDGQAVREPARAAAAPAAAPEPRPQPGSTPGARSTLVLVVAIVLLIGVAAAEGWYLWRREDPVVSAERPVVTGEVAHRSAVEAASEAADDIVSTSYKNYDDQVEQAVSKMTDGFASQYRQTAEDVRDEFVDAEKEVQVEVAAAGVVRASPTQVEALLFLNQYVTTAGKDTAYTPYRALVTVVDTEQGWLVSDIETK